MEDLKKKEKDDIMAKSSYKAKNQNKQSDLEKASGCINTDRRAQKLHEAKTEAHNNIYNYEK